MGVVIPIYLDFLPWNKLFFEHLLARTIDFGMIDTPAPMNWDGGPVERTTDRIHNGKDVWPVWVSYIPSRALYQSLPKSFKYWFTLATASHTHNTRWSNLGCLKIPSDKAKIYGRHSVNISAFYTWNYLQKLHVNILFYQLPLTKLKSLIKKILYL